MNDQVMEERSLEELADRIGAVIAWVGAALSDEAVDGDVEGRVRGWISGLQPRARANFLAVALSDRYHAEGPSIVQAVRDGLNWPGVRSPAALDPARYSCEPDIDAAEHDVPGRAGAGRVQPGVRYGDALRE
jgi:hypothetical protein